MRRTEVEQEGSLGEAPLGSRKAITRLTSPNDFNYWKDVTRYLDVISHYKSFNEMVQKMKEISDLVARWIDGYEQNERYRGEGWSAFREDWKYARMLIPLQIRLCAEQHLSDKGYPWKSCVTGFGAIP